MTCSHHAKALRGVALEMGAHCSWEWGARGHEEGCDRKPTVQGCIHALLMSSTLWPEGVPPKGRSAVGVLIDT